MLPGSPAPRVEEDIQVPLADPKISGAQPDVRELAVTTVTPDGVAFNAELGGHIGWPQEPVFFRGGLHGDRLGFHHFSQLNARKIWTYLW